ncbi:Putative amino acid transporter, transmembrane domain-containing protein [Septoria linicola]|uniref:Amino acid transporter, transmembrane domain-containing protein n=1 Tax=Septoria linicola TaxID=215465 RepID=A0A9Q9AE92_9PEZI|nr:putative amino acid transporter, transmembrane domain-containing protein [Septoria linicola]USW47510.1 Putative amino acid transporter, transmembrane domain-containing protein [Septoria linicola]
MPSLSPTFSIEKKSYHDASTADQEVAVGTVIERDDDEVFRTDGEVNFRTVGWPRASVIFLKIIFATGVLSIPTAMVSLGAVGGALNVVGWGALNTYTAIVQGDFRNNHRKCHSIADVAHEVGGPWLREICGALFIVAYVLCCGSGILGVSIGLDALSTHATCTVTWAFVATVAVIATASVRKFHQIGWLTWAGFASIFVAVFIVVVAVTTRDRPAAAPLTGEYDLGYYVFPSEVAFVAGMVASCSIFVSSAGTSAFLPVISEMRNPQDYRKAVYVCMGLVTAAYLSFSLVVYHWCGQWVASPSLGSGGQTVKMIAYGIGLVGLIVSACLYLHVAAKYVFVRILRDSRHLQADTWTHWLTWLGCTIGLGLLSFVLAEAIPIFNYLLALTGSLCFAPIAISLPGWLWLYDHKDWYQRASSHKLAYGFHAFLIPLGLFFLIAGTYGVIEQIIAAYQDGLIGSAFSCADNSGST